MRPQSQPLSRVLHLLLFLLLLVVCHSVDCLQVGVGYADITGPAGEVPMMGYAEASQKTHGIHTRLFARAFVFVDEAGNRAAFADVEAGMISQMLKLRVCDLLEQRLGSVYTLENLLLSATHTHSGPGGFHGYTLYAISTLGYMSDTFESFAYGIADSIVQAHQNRRPAKIFYNEGDLDNASINRSPSSYLLNPEEERNRYSSNVDRTMQLLKIVDANTGEPFASLNWFPVHCTSMNNTNLMISGDNKGWAAQLFERMMDKGERLPGEQKFVAAFANGNEGDVSPNIRGPRCIDTGEPCDIITSACGGSAKHCIANGPGVDMIDSTRIIAMRQFVKAKSLFESATEELRVDKIDYAHQNVDMSSYSLKVNGQTVSTCKPAMGFSFAAGTTDGPGGFDFTQGDTSGNKFWNLVRNIISKPSAEQIRCQHPKPILLNTGAMTFPTEWQPSIVETQLIRIGDLVIVGLPGEFTTMSGRRIREAVSQTLRSHGLTNAKVVLSGLSNLYSSYIATYEEYQAQRYEGASTIFGPHTQAAYADQFTRLAESLATGRLLPLGPQVPNLFERIKSWAFVTPVVYDTVGIGKSFGDVTKQPKDTYVPGNTVEATFLTGHPRNNLMLGDSFLLVQRKMPDGNWETVCNDACAETRFQWIRTNSLLGRSEAHMSWVISACAQAGTYRMVHRGYYKPMLLWQSPKSFVGVTREFRVANSPILRLLRRGRYTADVINTAYGCGCV